MALALCGAAVGVLGAFRLTRLLQSLLLGVGTKDGFTFCAIPVLLLLVALLAGYIPARQGARVDPTAS